MRPPQLGEAGGASPRKGPRSLRGGLGQVAARRRSEAEEKSPVLLTEDEAHDL